MGAWVNENSIFMCDIKTMDFSPLVVYLLPEPLRRGHFLTNYCKDNPERIPKVSISVLNKFNPYMDYKNFMIPAYMVIVIILLGGFLPALNIVGEKEKGTIEQINITPVRKTSFIFAKLIPYWVMGLIVLSICMLLAWAVYGLSPHGGIWTVYLFSLLFIFALSGFGLIVSNYSDTMQQAMFVMFFFILVFMLMSGLLTPISSMPEWA